MMELVSSEFPGCMRAEHCGNIVYALYKDENIYRLELVLLSDPENLKSARVMGQCNFNIPVPDENTRLLELAHLPWEFKQRLCFRQQYYGWYGEEWKEELAESF